MNILIVDDDSDDVYFLRELLAEAGAGSARIVHVEHVEDLHTVLKRRQEEPFDIVLLDFFLAGSQGTESLSRLRKYAPDVPVVFMTGLNDENLGQQMIKAGAQGYIVKGQLEGETLLCALREVISRYRR